MQFIFLIFFVQMSLFNNIMLCSLRLLWTQNSYIEKTCYSINYLLVPTSKNKQFLILIVNAYIWQKNEAEYLLNNFKCLYSSNNKAITKLRFLLLFIKYAYVFLYKNVIVNVICGNKFNNKIKLVCFTNFKKYPLI